ncbi:NAD-binding protein [Caldisphaera lagunensis]|uniref:NAD-binding protein n=1 Tax=Caldisphaera lagunensis TaxID=200415 RepID=UPI0006623503|nr:NAD-binding protein [Caldisphaera lagunensis]
MSKNAIIGGVGFVGVNIAEELSKDSNVVIVTRKSSIEKRPNITKRLKELGAEFIVLDKIDYNGLKNLDADNFIYTIGIISGNLKEMMVAHVNILEDVIKVAKEISSRVIYI